MDRHGSAGSRGGHARSASNPFRDRVVSDENRLGVSANSSATEESFFHDALTSPQTGLESPYPASSQDIRPMSHLPVDDAFNYEYDLSPTADLSNSNTFEHISERERIRRLPTNARKRYEERKKQQEYQQDGTSTSSTADDAGALSPNLQHRHISFAQADPPSSVVDADDQSMTEVTFQDDSDAESTAKHKEAVIDRSGTVMKRHRWGTQRHKNKPKRSKSIFKKRHSGILHHDHQHDSHPPHDSDSDEQKDLNNLSQKQGREVFINIPLPESMTDPESGLPLIQYARNKIRTTKYTPLSFVPKNLFHQFHNVANIFFLFIVILGAFPIFGVESPGMAAVPIIVIVCITAVKDAIEDYRRTVLDMELNNTTTELLSGFNNVNVTDENISYWRRFKKANTRLVLRIARFIKNSKEKRKAKKKGELPVTNRKSLELARTRTVQSVYSNRDSIALDDYSNQIRSPFEEEPRNPDSVLDPTSASVGSARFKRDFWKNVRVGDFVRIRNNDEIPADIVILATSDSDGACYVETKNLDGETNLKVRQALKCGDGIKHAKDCECSQFWIESEAPMPNLYSYNGAAKWRPDSDDADGEIRTESISINNLLLRGCTLRNTQWVIGVVLFTGSDTKIMLNSGITPTKRSQISKELNLSVITNFVLLFILCFVSGLMNGIDFAAKSTSIDYFEFGMIGGNPPVNGIVTFWAVIIVYQGLVPISLYISIEIVKTVQAFFIYSDCYMYYEPVDYPCTPKSWNISDDLGQIEYIFSDKTGTLTQNVMEFKKCTINGIAYGKAYTEALAGLRKREGVDVDEEGARMRKEISADKSSMIKKLRKINDNPQVIDDEITFISSQFVDDLNNSSGDVQKAQCRHFMLALALCHSVVTEPSKIHPGRKDFKAQSPDEAALVATARDMGFTFVERTKKGVIINVQGHQEEYQILNTLEFNSTRKRMSAIVKFKSDQSGTGKERILLICKGADSVIYSRLSEGAQKELREQTALHLEQFANEGLRTLCISERELSLNEYTDWNRRHEVAAAAITNREERMEEVADSIERNLSLIGGTAIEDRLQDGVPQTIELLGDAGIKLWVLTGDKVETAINIGFSCNLLNSGMELLIIKAENGRAASVEKLLDDYLDQYFHMTATEADLEEAKKDHSPPSPDFAVIIDGDSLKFCLEGELRRKFLLLCKQCKSILCCRVSPAQKAAVVRLVKTSLKVMTLSIGDGANDVAMIQEADVGVGIAGEEGRQAVMSSDYAIGQFRFLNRLLLVHGRWSYRRLAEMIPNFFYKNVVFTLTLFWYGIFSSFDSTYLFEYTYVMFFNLAFTSLPVIFMGFLDQDVSDVISLKVPQLYRRGILRLDWTQAKFWVYMADGFYQSFICFFFPYFLYATGGFQDPNGRAIDHRYWMGVTVCTIAVFGCNLYIILNQYQWDWLSLLINAISSLLIFFWTGIYSATVASEQFYSAAAEVYGSLIFWCLLLLGVIACILPKFVFHAYQKLFRPLDVDIVRERWKLGDYDEAIYEQDKIVQRDTAIRKKTKEARKLEKKRLKNGAFEDMQKPAVGTKGSTNSTGSSGTAGSEISRRQSIRDWARSPTFRGSGQDRQDDGMELVGLGGDRLETVSTIGSDADIRFGSGYVSPETQRFRHVPGPDRRQSGEATAHDIQYYRRSMEAKDGIRESLDKARKSLQWEQRPSSPGLESVRVSMELNDLTTADGLIRSMSSKTKKSK